MKIAFAGAGYIINIHARAAQALEDVTLWGVVEKFSEKARALAERYAIPQQFETVEQMLRVGSVDALVIGTPNYLHAPQAIAALEAGVHVMVEKPMAMNVPEAEAMIAASQKSGALLMVAHCWRFDEDVNWLKARTSQLGRIIRTKGYGVHVHWGPGGWFTQQALAGGGAMADMGIHAIDTARYLLGDPQPVSVYAKIGTHYNTYDVDDTGVVFVEWDSGATSYIESGWWQPHTDGPEAATQLYGEKGFGQLFPTLLELPDPAAETVRVVNPGFAHPREEHCPQSMYDAQLAYFLHCIRTLQPPNPGGQEGLVNMKVIQAAYESSRSGKVIQIV